MREAEYLTKRQSNAMISITDSDYFSLTSSPNAGRFLIASKNITAGTVILKAPCFATVTDFSMRKRICWKCRNSLAGSRIACCKCRIIHYCSELCETLDKQYHNKYECAALPSLASSDLNDFTVTVALLVLKILEGNNQLQFKSGFDDVLQLVTNRISFPLQIVRDLKVIERIIHKIAVPLLSAEIDAVGLAMRVLCNSFGTRRNSSVICMHIAPTASYFNHSCTPNTCRVQYHSEPEVLVFQTIQDIRAGQPVTISYIPLMQTAATKGVDSAESRMKLLQELYHFKCQCLLCSRHRSCASWARKHMCELCDGRGFMIPVADSGRFCSLCGMHE